jgi:prepilin-type N-terminal cleavage/methylation domain-containing protein
MSAGQPPVESPIGLRRARDRRRGFTVTELAVVILILSMLGAGLVPMYLRSVYRSRRTEALYALRAIHDFESVNYSTYGEYSDSFPALGFDLAGGKQRPDGAYQGPYYTFTLSRWALGGVPNANYRATASGDLDKNDATLDVVIIENALTVVN